MNRPSENSSSRVWENYALTLEAKIKTEQACNQFLTKRLKEVKSERDEAESSASDFETLSERYKSELEEVIDRADRGTF